MYLPMNIFFLKSGHYGAIDLWNNINLPKNFSENDFFFLILSCIFALELGYLLHKI